MNGTRLIVVEYSNAHKEFLDMFHSHNFMKIAKSSSRDLCLGLIFCNDDTLIEEAYVLLSVSRRDPASADLTLKLSLLAVIGRKRIGDLNRAEYDAIEQYSKSIDWVASLAILDTTEEKYGLFADSVRVTGMVCATLPLRIANENSI
ncbi:unnamed protein product [Haemonchus placei]|uniref:Coatomer_WDAD domain-containing protein n=1 Tax=Haemonchus placei TaxID=6290 RepID=A0A0N4W422_HAEPC|nr:unnamed protein product [Haemonchus placei]